MKIIIDNKNADIVLENEKTVGDVLSGIETWLSSAGLRISGITLAPPSDGQNAEGNGDAGLSADLFNRPLEGIECISIKTALVSSLHIEALYQALEMLAALGNCGDGTSSPMQIQKDWESSAGAHFLFEHDYSIFKGICEIFSGKGSTEIKDLIGKQLESLYRVIKDPIAEFRALEAEVGELTGRLIDLPLDMQTGKDKRAAETIDVFSRLTEKMFGLIRLVFHEETTLQPLDEFNAALKEFLAAYENKDMVLIGDLAEYELAPRLNSIYNEIRERTA
ncbi:MAG: hypothetical protein Ta2G_11030 [Termitinemataceae bacterium]|nr:MAG: hypothetical protein Ta2G_11030 [Termitinemataceae bacterium]